MIDVYLFDWGDTLMVDLTGTPGKMCEWDKVEAVDGAKETLSYLSQHAKIYVATGASESSENEIKMAFDRVNMSRYISGYFCKQNIGVLKGEPEFLQAIISALKISPSSIAMVGDSLEKDVYPAIEAGINPIWFSKTKKQGAPAGVKVISFLNELCI